MKRKKKKKKVKSKPKIDERRPSVGDIVLDCGHSGGDVHWYLLPITVSEPIVVDEPFVTLCEACNLVVENFDAEMELFDGTTDSEKTAAKIVSLVNRHWVVDNDSITWAVEGDRARDERKARRRSLIKQKIH